jgi:ketosteroid isomerase-like protein
MSRTLLALIFIFALSNFSTDSFGQKESVRTQNRRALVEMEHAFAKAAATKGTRDAFLEFLADDGIIFQPGPVNGKKYWTERQPRKGLLSWEPAFADVSRAGDLGYTTGPWEFRPNGPDDKPVAFGQYFTIWKKQSDGSWKAVLDRGVSSDKAIASEAVRFPLHDEDTTKTTIDREQGKAALLEQERKFSQAAALNAYTAFDLYLADDARLLRENAAPTVGKSAAAKLLPSAGRALTWTPAMCDISQSGDLGYTYGAFELNTRGVTLQRGSYVRVWKKVGVNWKVVVDVMSPDPQS